MPMPLPVLHPTVWLLAALGLALAVGLAWRCRRGTRRALAALAATRATLQRQAAAHDEALRHATAADQAKARFLAAASHDLRQPAHALGLYLAALRAGPLATEQAAIAARMAQALAAMDGLFGAVLDLSRIDAGAVLPHWELVALGPLLQRLADEWAPAAEARGLRLVLRAGPADATTVTDAVLLERVLRNLLANAVAHTLRGGVVLACRLRRAADGPPRLRIEVWDSGTGIAPRDQERVFQEFEQLGRADGGLGLGLAIARRLAQQLQLQLSLLSRPGRGTVFFVDGLVPAGAMPRQAAAARGALRRLAGMRVAVVDDDAAVRDATHALLQRWECDVTCAADADALLQALGDGPPPQALLVDLHLAAGRRGPDEAQRLFGAWGCTPPLLLMTGDTAAAPALRAEGRVCLAKPLSPPRLRAWLEQALFNAPSTPSTPSEAAP